MRTTSRKEQGQAIVEFALVMPVLMLLLFGVVYFAMAFNLQMVLNTATREGARAWASNRGNTSPCCSACTSPCDPISDSENGFRKNVIPLIEKYLTDNGYNKNKLIYQQVQVSNEDLKQSDWNAITDSAEDATKVKLVLEYEYQIPAAGLDLLTIHLRSSYTMKRGS